MAVIEATEQNFEECIQCEYAMVDFYGEHCGACVFTAPYFREAADAFAFIHFVKVNTSAYPALAKRFDIKALPTFVYFQNGQPVHRTTGGMDAKMIRKELSVLLYGKEEQTECQECD